MADEVEELSEVDLSWDRLEGMLERGNTPIFDYDLAWDEGNETRKEFETLV